MTYTPTPTLDFYPLTPTYFASAGHGAAMRPTFKLALPQLNPGSRLLHVSARCDPNPSHIHPSTKHQDGTSAGVMLDPRTAITTIYLQVRPPRSLTFRATFALYVHRSSLLKLYEDSLPYSTPLPPPEPDEVQLFLTLPYSPLKPLTEFDMDMLVLDDPGEDPLLFQYRSHRRTLFVLRWEEWGEANTKMFDYSGVNTDWVTTSCGWRAVRSVLLCVELWS